MAHELGNSGRVQRQTAGMKAKQAPAGHGLSESQQLQRRLGNEAIGQLVGGQATASQTANNSLQAIVNRPIVTANGQPPAIQRDIPKYRYETGEDKQTTEDGKATEEYANKLNVEVQKAWAAVQAGPLLGSEWNIDGHTQLWIDKMTDFAKTGEDPGGLHTTFGYVVESLVSGPLKPEAPAGYQVVTQGARGGTRPDFILRKGFQDVGWLDLTASKSKGHIFDKAGGWEQVPSIAEITYPSIEQEQIQAMKGKVKYNKESDSYESAKLSFEGIDPNEMKKRIAEAKAALEAKKANWKNSFTSWLLPAATLKADPIFRDERRRAKTKTILKANLKLAEHPELEEAALSDKVVTAMLAALGLRPQTYGFVDSVSVTTGLSYLQELDPDPNFFAPNVTESKKDNKSKLEKRKESYKAGFDPKKAKEARLSNSINSRNEKRTAALNARRGLTDSDTVMDSPEEDKSDLSAMKGDDTIVQPKLEVNQPNDPLEQEADRVARQLSRPDNGLTAHSYRRFAISGGRGKDGAAAGVARRQLSRPDSSVTTMKMKGNQASETVQREIEGQRGQGQIIDNNVRQPMEQAFGNSFAGVNIHTDAKADSLNRDLGARAFTTGRDIFFRQGEYQPQAPAGKELLAHELTHVVQQGGATNTVQRSVGFEFEDSSWRAWKYDIGGLRPAARKEVLHQGNHFTLEGDDTPGPQASNLEFVTEPFETTPAGIGQLNATMTEIKDIVGRIGQFSGRTGNLDNTAPDQFVLGHQHQLQQPNTRLSAGQPHARFKMQATQGISAEDLPTIMKYLGTNVPGETAPETQERAPARQAMYGDQQPTNLTNLLGSTPALARQAVDNFVPQLTAAEQPLFANPSALIGFVSALIMYLKLLAVQSGNVLKYNIPLLARNNFVALYQSIPFTQRYCLRQAGNSNLFFQSILFGANQQAFIPRPAPAGGGFWDANRQLGDPLTNLRIKRTADGPAWDRMRVMDSLTIQDWLQGIVLNQVDHLQPHTILNWLNNHENHVLDDDQRRRAAGMLESFASLGGNKDEAEQAGKSKLGIFENRGIAGNNLNEDIAHHKALNYLTFFVNLRQNNGQPGQFPDNPVP